MDLNNGTIDGINNNSNNSSIISSLLYRVIYGIPKCVNTDSEEVMNRKKIRCHSLCSERNQLMNRLKTSEEIESLSIVSPIGYFGCLPNEVIAIILEFISYEDMSMVSITSKAFRDFVIEFFIKSKTGFQTLLSNYCFAINSKTNEEQEKRLNIFKSLGLLLKRSTCLYPTTERISLLIQVFNKMDGIPAPSLSPLDNNTNRFIFQCYGRLIHKLIAGWDDSECVYVFEVLQSITHMEQRINTLLNTALGARQSLEYYIRNFYRNICIDPIDRSDRYKDRIFWLTQILKAHTLENRAKLLLIMFGPLISLSPTPGTLPYIGWWDLTDTFFIQNGLEELGFAIHLLFSHQNNITLWNRKNVISLFETIISLPENWLQENTSALLFFSGDDITHEYLVSKLSRGNYSEVAQSIVYLTLITYKLTNDTNPIMELIEKLGTEDRKNLINEIPIAFTEAIADIDNLIELEDERDVTELHEIISAQSDLMKVFMLKSFDINSKTDSNSDKESQNSTEFKKSHEE